MCMSGTVPVTGWLAGMLRIGLLFSVFFVLSGCSFNAAYHPEYVAHRPAETNLRIPGKALVYTPVEDDSYIYSGSPTSFTGGGTSLEIPLGNIAGEISVEVLKHICTGGVFESDELVDLQGYQLILRPRVTHFEYAYNQLKNAGFAVTPQARISLQTETYDQDGRIILTRSYDSGLVDGDTYMFSGEPAEVLNRLVHATLADMIEESAIDSIAVSNSIVMH